MSFAHFYFGKFAPSVPLIEEPASENLSLIVTMPCFNEPNIVKALEGLYFCVPTKGRTEVIVLLNFPAHRHDEFEALHQKQFVELSQWAQKHNSQKLQFYILLKALPLKDAGVGLARKIAMDEALRRFNAIGNARGIIAGFDADCTCSPNYLTEIENTFFNTNVNGCSVYFEHPTDGNEFEPKIYESITSYELYLRYYVEALRNARFPYAFHTLGSSFAVTAEAYARQGGMNKRKAGEDFYFLHKIIPMGNFVELNSCAVYPSPRCSNRVPFGTGAAVNKILQFNNTDYLVFNPRVFEILQPLFDNAYTLMGADKAATCESFNKMHPALSDFLKTQKAEEALETINENCKNKRAFFNAFYNWFNGLMVLQFLNFAHDKYFEKVRISQAVMSICNLNATKNIELLFFLRNKQRSSGWQPINYRQQ